MRAQPPCLSPQPLSSATYADDPAAQQQGLTSPQPLCTITYETDVLQGKNLAGTSRVQTAGAVRRLLAALQLRGGGPVKFG